MVNTINGSNNTITLGDGNNDTVYSGGISTIKIGNGPPIHVGTADTITVGTGQDSFVFDQTVAGTIGAVTINHFDPSKDVIVLTQTLVPGQNVLPAHDDANGNAVVTVVPGDTITLVGVHSSALHASDFQFGASSASPQAVIGGRDLSPGQGVASARQRRSGASAAGPGPPRTHRRARRGVGWARRPQGLQRLEACFNKNERQSTETYLFRRA